MEKKKINRLLQQMICKYLILIQKMFHNLKVVCTLKIPNYLQLMKIHLKYYLRKLNYLIGKN